MRNRRFGIVLAVAMIIAACAATPAAALTWQEAPPPPLTFGHLAFLDTTAHHLIVVSNTIVWTYDLVSHAWVDIAATQGGATLDLQEVSGILDPVRNRVICLVNVYGLPNYFELWTLDLSSHVWQSVARSNPGYRTGYGFVYDRKRDRALLYGGYLRDNTGAYSFVNDLNALDLATLTWSQPTIAGTSPLGRGNFVWGYDPVYDRMVMFGGTSHTALDSHTPIVVDETWELLLSGTPRWKFLTPATPHPSARTGTVGGVVGNHRLLAMCGSTTVNGNPVNEAWTLALDDTSMAHWTQVSAGGSLVPREFAAITCDSIGNRMLLQGGQTQNGHYVHADVWSLTIDSVASWGSLGDDAPPALWATTAVSGEAFYDSLGKRVIVAYSTGTLLEVWAKSMDAVGLWSLLSEDASGIGNRHEFSLIWDAPRRRILLFGGYDYQTNARFNDVWANAGSGWSPLSTAGTPPSPRSNHSAIFDAAGQRMIVFGGQTAPSPGSVVSDTWALSLASTPTWTRLSTTNDPSAQYRHAALYDAQRGSLVVFAGRDSFGAAQGPSELPLNGSLAWHSLASNRPKLVPSNFGPVFDALRTRFLVAASDTLWVTSLGGKLDWTPLLSGDAKLSLLYALAADDPVHDRLVIFGGYYPGNAARYLYFGAVAGVGDPAPSVQVSRARISVMPQPSHGAFSLWLSMPRRDRASFELLDLAGRRIASEKLGTLEAGAHVVHLDRGIVQRAGLYFVNAHLGSETVTARVVIIQ